MCIFFLPTKCPFAGLEPSRPLSISVPYHSNTSRRTSVDEAASSSAPSNMSMSSRSSITTMSSYSYGSSDSLDELLSSTTESVGSKTSNSTSEQPPVKHFRIATSESASSQVDAEAVICTSDPSTAEDSSAFNADACITALTTLTSLLEDTESTSIEVGRCLDPTSSSPHRCKNFQTRHRSSFARQTGYFDTCTTCTDVGRQWQASREREWSADEVYWEQEAEHEFEMKGKGQKQMVKKAETGMCSTQGCDGCRPGRLET